MAAHYGGGGLELPPSLMRPNTAWRGRRDALSESQCRAGEPILSGAKRIVRRVPQKIVQLTPAYAHVAAIV
jgi:hypothetical protein